MADSDTTKDKVPLRADQVEVTIRHALEGVEIKVPVRKTATFKHLRSKLSKFLRREEALKKARFVKKEKGVYGAYKDSQPLADIREVLVIGVELTVNPDGPEDDGVSSQDEAEPPKVPANTESKTTSTTTLARKPAGKLMRVDALNIQKELHEGFSSLDFKYKMQEIERKLKKGTTAFYKERQALLLSVQATVLPKYGYEGSLAGVYEMMASMGPYTKDPEFQKMATEINQLIGVESPPETWDDLVKTLKNDQSKNKPTREKSRGAPPSKYGRSAGRLGFGPASLVRTMPGFGPAGAQHRAASVTIGPTDQTPVAKASAPSAPAPAPAPAAASNPRGKSVPASNQQQFTPAARTAPGKWPANKDPPVKLHIAGTFNDFNPMEMMWEGGQFLFPFQLGPDGMDAFQILVGGSWDKTYYPQKDGANPFEPYKLCGPDNKGHDKNWVIGYHPKDKLPPDTLVVVAAELDSKGSLKDVFWQRAQM